MRKTLSKKHKRLFAKIFFSLVAIVIVSFAYLSIETDYEKQMKPLMKLKKEEQGNNIKPPVYDGEVEPLFPDIDKNDETLEGVDSNHNGIRDDVEIWINRTFKNDIERRGMKRIARIENESIKYIILSDEKKVRELNWNKEKVYNCFVGLGLYADRKGDYSEVLKSDVFVKILYNNSKRRELDKKSGMLLAGDGPATDLSNVKKYCDF